MSERKKGAVPSDQERLREKISESVVMRMGQVPTYRMGSERRGKKTSQ